MFSSSLSGTKPATGSLFGQSAQPQQQVSQFGTTVTNNNTNNTGGSFGNTNTTSGGLFGNTNNNSSTTTGGLFGNSNSNTNTNTGGLFGNTNNNTNTTSGGLFGNTNNNTGSTLGNGLFGNKPSTTTGGLFGNNNTSGNTGGLFNNSLNNTTSTNTGGIFGNSLNNNNVLSSNQQSQQQNTMQPQVLPQKRQRKIVFDQPRLLPSWTKLSDDCNQPTREVIKRLTNLDDEDDKNKSNVDESDSDIEFEEDIFGNVGFGKVKKNGSKMLRNKGNLSVVDIDNDSPSLKQANILGSNQTDIPPMKSLYDIEKELEIDSKIQQRRSNHTFMDQEVTQKVDQSSKDFTSLNIFDRSDNKTPANTNKLDESTNNETELYSCIIFGYPENIATQVISHFNKFGEILEDFPFLNKSNKNHNKVTIQTGDSWCKITYDNKVSYTRALKENGTQYCGYVIGCVPFKKTQAEGTVENVYNEGSNNIEPQKEHQSGLLKGDIFQKGGVTSMIEKHLKNEKKLNESGNKITVKLNEMLFGFGNGEKDF